MIYCSKLFVCLKGSLKQTLCSLLTSEAYEEEIKKKKKAFTKVNKVESDEREKLFEVQMNEREMVVTNIENKVSEEDKKLIGRKAYLLDKEKNIDKREDMMHKKEKELGDMERKKFSTLRLK